MPISTSKEIALEKLSAPVEGILYFGENISCYNKDTNVGTGKLFVTERSILWLNTEDLGFYLNYQKINIHAISRNINSFPHPCIYIMLEPDFVNEEVMANDDNDGNNEDDDDDDDNIREIRFVPSDPASLDDIYNSMSKGNALNPDPNDSNSAEEEDDEYEGDEGQGDGGHDIANGDGSNGAEEEDAIEEGQFDDDVMQS